VKVAARTVRLATPADARAIAVLSRDFIEHTLAWSWTEARVRRAIAHPGTNVAVIHRGGCLQGFGIMQYGDESAHLALLGVQPTLRRRGLGRTLVAWLEACARTAGLGQVRVEARADNPAAVAFYERLGYAVVGRTHGYYAARIDAIRFAKPLWTHAGEGPA
jgi:ribosomal-protein-alanine N-acetyltransferase